MPHILVKCYKGRSEEVKKSVAEKIADAAAQAFAVDKSAVSVSIEEVEKSDWKKVYDQEIIGKPDSLYVKPGYEE
ncbi:MAG: tautomerase family protein [Treponema sp.]|nr:tautomerase family protein [Treponema sp.]